MDILAAQYLETKAEIAALEAENRKRHDALLEYIQQTGEPLEIEGLGVLREGQRNTYSYDLTAVDEAQWARLRELQVLKIDRPTLKRMQERGLITGIREQVGSTPMLVVEKER